MLKRLLTVAMVVLFTLSLGTMVLADEIKGTIAAIADKEITVKSKDGKEVTVNISSKRTAIKGAARADLKAGTKVTMTHDGKEAQTIEVREAK
ncbi:MAG: hypothetical protein HY742_08250 [Deltaproteobacteria bacterium]|nr:hypothetical protein [Deltaproteobacteria bacterium]